MKDKYLIEYQNQNQEIKNDDLKNKKNNIIKQRNVGSFSNEDKNNKKINLINIRPNSYSKTHSNFNSKSKSYIQELKFKWNTIDNYDENNFNVFDFNKDNINVFKICIMVINFLKDMNNLQKLILKKSDKIKEFKKNLKFQKII